MNYKHNFIGYTGDQVGTDKDPVAYGGFLIYERTLTEEGEGSWNGSRFVPCRITGQIWAVVKDGQEVSQLAGPNGARRAIDRHLSGEDKFKEFVKA